MVSITASEAPAVTKISFSGFTSIPFSSRSFLAIACRSSSMPMEEV